LWTVTIRICVVWTPRPYLLGMGLYPRPRVLYLHRANQYEAVRVFGCV